jgi:SAM-dependent methyltransferase
MIEDDRLTVELYEKSAGYYDYHADWNDKKFYVDLALESGGPVLELGCGTGRISLLIARSGVPVTGLDRSEAMLKVFQRKLADEPEPVKKRVTLVQGDMRNFSLDMQFSLAIIPFGPFNLLFESEDQISCLTCIRKHLADRGTLAMDVMYHDLRKLSENIGKELAPFKKPFQMQDGRSFTLGWHQNSIDYNRQITFGEMVYSIQNPDGRQERMVFPDNMRYFFRYEIEHLLARTGFKTEAEYADFDKTPFGTKYPSELIFFARKTQ